MPESRRERRGALFAIRAPASSLVARGAVSELARSAHTQLVLYHTQLGRTSSSSSGSVAFKVHRARRAAVATGKFVSVSLAFGHWLP